MARIIRPAMQRTPAHQVLDTRKYLAFSGPEADVCSGLAGKLDYALDPVELKVPVDRPIQHITDRFLQLSRAKTLLRGIMFNLSS
jgi:hypothetical protein